MAQISLTVSVPTITWNSLQIENLIGRGGYGDVYKGSWYGKEVAIKELLLKKLPEDLINDFDAEAKIMAQCKCAQVVSLLAICLDPGHYAMVMEYMSKGSLYQILRDKNEELPWNPIRFKISIDIGKGLAYLHSQNIVHRDLKSLNVLLDQNYNAKITDFGLAKIKMETTSTSTQSHQSMGTVRWLAPELFKRNARPNFASDIYAEGMVLWELASRKIPFIDASNEQLVVSWIKDGEQETIPPDCPPQIAQLIKSCWEISTEKRPSSQEVSLKIEQAAPKQQITSEKSWKVDVDPAQLPPGQKYVLLPATAKDMEKVLKSYSHHPVPGYEIESVKVIYNPTQILGFRSHLGKLQERSQSTTFDPKWPWDLGDVNWRQKVDTLFQQMAAEYLDSEFPSVKLLPLWHGTDPTFVDSICRVGYVNLSSTDVGFFGRGLYSSHEAEYAFRVYSKGALILNWVAIYSAYPVIDGDTDKLLGRANYQNYDAHFVLVSPNDPNNLNEKDYYPSKPNTKHSYTEVVVFESAACLPSYLIELKEVNSKLARSFQSKKTSPPPISPQIGQGINNTEKSTSRGEQKTITPPRSTGLGDFGKTSPSMSRSLTSNSQKPVPPPKPIGINPLPSQPPEEKEYLNGLKYFNGSGVKKSYETAAKYFMVAAEKGYALAQFKLGWCYRQGNLGVPKDTIKGEHYLNLAFDQNLLSQLINLADRGSIIDQNHLGLCYQHGLGIERDERKAFYYFKMAADRGDTGAQNNVALCYDSGIGVTPNPQLALKYYTLSADQGNPSAQYNLGCCFENGNGVPIDYHQAIKYYQMAADQGHGYAQNNLGVIYKNGIGGETNYQKAFNNFKLAAEQGVPNAHYNLGVCYENGQGTGVNEQLAMQHYGLAASQEDPKAGERIARLSNKKGSTVKVKQTDGGFVKK